MGTNSYKVASVWVKDKWVSLAQVTIIRYYSCDDKQAIYFDYDGELLQSYIEFIDLYKQNNNIES
jgi:hypothetical protein